MPPARTFDDVTCDARYDFFTMPSGLAQLDKISGYLKDQRESVSAHHLSSIVIDFHRAQDEASKLDLDSLPTRINMECFMDFRRNGALHCILETLLSHGYTGGPTNLSDHAIICSQIRRHLKQHNCICLPTSTNLPPASLRRRDSIEMLIEKHEGVVVHSEEDADHIVYPVVSTTPSVPTSSVMFRPVRILEDKYLLHFPFKPDSKDAWVSVGSSKRWMGVVTDCDNDGTWHVSANWVIDSDRCNEWMNDEDYEIDEKKFSSSGLVEYKTKQHRSVKLTVLQKSITRAVTVPKSNEMENTVSRSSSHRILDDMSTRQSFPNADDATALTNQQNGSMSTPQSPPRRAGMEYAVVLPSYASWFDYNSIHDIEKRALPEFFKDNPKDCSKTPELYITYRNFMVDTYRTNPSTYLTATACRRNLMADTCGLLRIHAFLEQWGIINYQIDPDKRPVPLGPPCTNNVPTLSHTPTGLVVLPPFNPPMEFTSVKTENGMGDSGEDEDMSEVHSSMRKPYVDKTWTKREIFALLEGVEKYRDDWGRISESVGTRSAADCILKFIQLPANDPAFGEKDDEDLISRLLVLSDMGNPIMKTVAILAGAVDPRVARAACEAAVKEMVRLKEQNNGVNIESDKVKAHADYVWQEYQRNNGIDYRKCGLSDLDISRLTEEKKKTMRWSAMISQNPWT
ncbi:hypothetical protein ACOME3_002580 [Neoechinorhynchus agilis]